MTVSQLALLAVQHISIPVLCHGFCQYTKARTHASFFAAGEMMFMTGVQAEKIADMVKVACP